MPELRPPELYQGRLPCPSCLGLPMEKIHFEGSNLVLDSCTRCGGIWFDKGEVELLSQINAQMAQKQIQLQPKTHIMQCHQCMNPMERNLDRCSRCNWENKLDCPSCNQTMSIARVDGLKLDYCKKCQGVWFDNVELSTIWNRRLERLAGAKQPGHFDADDTAGVFLDILFYSPHLAFYTGEAIAETIIHAPELAEGAINVVANAPELAAGAVEALAHAPDLAAGMLEGVGDLAGGIFGAIGEIISGLFDL
ncbi:MAG: hypothetical protein CVV27_05695 [Candidatus Melainabacteria bacterium HGW-Melainabacteria-1]|nr:MAG: hypothetical protein CVV27_05695 [Candidatus Melainabacteria bacterium HGW-Melainabacteria-1]